MSDLPLPAPERGFERIEFEKRTQELQRHMRKEQLDAVFFTNEPEFRYFSGFKSQFWESPTRPWFLVVPAEGKPIGVIPEIGLSGLESTWVDDIRCWPSPRPEDDGVSLLASTLREHSNKFHTIGVMTGPETHLRMPAANFSLLQNTLSQYKFVDISSMLTTIRSIKSAAEIEKIRFACSIASVGFDRLREQLHIGISEREACKILHLDMLKLGADSCPYLISGSGKGGYDSIIMGPSDRQITAGDVLILDTGANFDGYFCDFDRNYAFGYAEQQTIDIYDTVYAATEAGLRVAAPGRTTGDVWQAMWAVMEKAGALSNDVGRMGHGLGMQLTEWPSMIPNGDVVLKPGMILTLEPGMTFSHNRMMVHEDNIVITDDGCELLNERTWKDLPVIPN